MRVIEAVNHAHIRRDEVSVFLAGGITDCPDWQADVIKAFDKHLHRLPVVLLNPRRANFPMHDPNASREQIEWEFDQLQRVDVVMFWFPKETLCPISLYELGFQLGKRYVKEGIAYPELVVGTHPDYARKADVAIQTGLIDSRIPIYDKLHSTTTATMNCVTNLYNLKNHNSF